MVDVVELELDVVVAIGNDGASGILQPGLEIDNIAGSGGRLGRSGEVERHPR